MWDPRELKLCSKPQKKVNYSAGEFIGNIISTQQTSLCPPLDVRQKKLSAVEASASPSSPDSSGRKISAATCSPMSSSQGSCHGASVPKQHTPPTVGKKKKKKNVAPIVNNSHRSHSLPPEGLVSWRRQQGDLTAPERSAAHTRSHKNTSMPAYTHTHTHTKTCQRFDPCVVLDYAPSG